MTLVLRICALAALAALATGCGDSMQTGECVARLVWRGADWAGTRGQPPYGEHLARTTELGCDDEPLRRVDLFAIPGVDESVAVVVVPDRGARYVGIGPGYLVASRRHPFHETLFDAEDLRGRVCGEPRRMRVRAVTTPLALDRPLRLAARGRADRAYLAGRGDQGEVLFDAGSRLARVARGGIPYVESGDRLLAVLRTCTWGRGARDWMRGSRIRFVVELAPAGSRR